MFEERGAVAVFKPLKDFANPVGCNCHLNLSFCLAICICDLSSTVF
jgi:hypothetical protein